MLTLIQRHNQTIAYQYVSEHGHSNFTMFTYICITDGSAWSYSRITLSFSSTSMTTVFQMVLLLRSPEGMQHTTRLHLTVMTCPTIMSVITFRFMPLIPSCILITIHPLFGLSTWIAVVASYIYMITYNLCCWTIWVPCKYRCHTILASKATSLLGFIA